MRFTEVIKKFVGALTSGININSNKQENCVNSPTIFGNNNSVNIGADIELSKEMPKNQKKGDFWFKVTGTDEEGK